MFGANAAGARKATAYVVTFLALAPAGKGGAAVYTVQQGDTIEIAVAGLPELRSRSNVQPDGAISFPLLGSLKVEGLTPSELRLDVQKQLSGKIYRMHTNDGREVLTVIEPEEVSAEIVGYRPIYVSGDVTHSGEQVFRPKMTVRQAIALAGGPGRPQSRASGFAREYETVKGEYDVARLEAARAALRAARTGAQLEKNPHLPQVDLSVFGLQSEVDNQLVASESQILETTLADYQREAAFLKAAVSQAADRIAVVEKQRTQEEEGSRADSVELQRMIDLLSRGQEINPRVTDARRALLLSSTRALQVNVELLDLKRQKAEGERNLERLDDQRRMLWLKELEDASAERTAAAIKVHALEVELYGSLKNRPVDTPNEPTKTSLEVVRQDGEITNKFAVSEGFELMPGDTIELTISAPNQTAVGSVSP